MDRIIETKWYYEVGPTRVGPLPWESFVQAARQGQFGPHCRVWSDGWTDWVPAVQVPGLFAAQQGPSSDAVTRAILPVGRAGSAIAAGYFGLLSPLAVFAPLAVIFGVVALRTLQREPHLHGAGRAWFGIIMGALFSIVYGFVFVRAGLQG